MSAPTNQPLLVNQLPQSLDLPKKYEDFHEIASLLLKRMIDALNKKEGALYDLQERGNFQQFFTANPSRYRNGYRKVFDLVALNGGPIAGGASVSFAHNIAGIVTGTRIYATFGSAAGVFATVTYPYASMTATDVLLTNPLGSDPLNYCIFVAEYVKSG